SVDFIIEAKGHGVVNWNGTIAVQGEDGKEINNHMIPKLRGYTNLSGKENDEKSYKFKKKANDINFKKNPLYISQNCIRHNLFKEFGYDQHRINPKNTDEALASLLGLLRGYVVPKSGLKRTSPLLITDFVDQLGNGNFEQFTTDKPLEENKKKSADSEQKFIRSSDTLYSRTTFGDTQYTAHGSISIEELQFISLDQKFDHCSMVIKSGQGSKVAKKIEDFLSSIKHKEDLNPKATYQENYCRIGSLFSEGEHGILLNDDAIEILVHAMIDKIKNLHIKQCKSYMYVTDVTVDYNDSTKPFRIFSEEVTGERDSDYAVYFEHR
ncbi:MAG: type I-Fv CRISPR-associated protein Cas7fv, partial [Flavobacteriaceae bacterium]